MSQSEEILRDRMEILERTIAITEKSNLGAGIDIVDDEGNLIEHISLKRDTTALYEKLAETKERLASTL